MSAIDQLPLVDTRDPIYGYNLDRRRAKAIRREISEAKNPKDAALGVAAIDAFAEGVTSPPPKPSHLDALFTAAGTRSLVVARNAGWAIGVLAIAEESVRDRIRRDWSSLPSQGRWAVLSSLGTTTPELRNLLHEIVGLALRDKSSDNRVWAAGIAQRARFHNYLPLIRTLVATEPDATIRSLYLKDADVLEKGFHYQHEPDGDVDGMMYVAAPNDGPTGFTVTKAAVEALGVDRLGRLAAAAIDHPSPERFRVFLDRLYAGNYDLLSHENTCV